MPLLLAQAPATPIPVDVGRDTVHDWLQRANQALADLPNFIERIDLLVAVLLVPLGVISLLYGLRIVKGMVVVYSSVGGAAAGWWFVAEVAGKPDLWWAGLLGGAVLMAALAWPMVNLFVGLYGAVAGGLAGFAVTHAMGAKRAMLIGVGVGVVVGALLAALVFRFMVVVMTSVLGAHMAVVGALALLYRVDKVAEPLRESLHSRCFLLPLLVAIPSLMGIAYQLYRTESREGKEDAGKTDRKE